MIIWPNTLSVIHNNPSEISGINREPSDAWPMKRLSTEVLTDDLIQVTMKNRMASMVDSMTTGSAFIRMLYGDGVAWSDRPWWWRLKWHLRCRALRVRDAWLVLTGRAEIGDDY